MRVFDFCQYPIKRTCVLKDDSVSANLVTYTGFCWLLWMMGAGAGSGGRLVIY